MSSSLILQLGWRGLVGPRGGEIRRQPYTVHAGDGYKVGYCKEKVLITLISVLDIMPLVIIYAVAYI